MTRAEKKAAKRATGHVRGTAPKGKPTPKQPPGNMTRAQHTRQLSRKARRELADAPGAAQRAVDALRGIRGGEQQAIEKLLREAGGIDLGRIQEKGQHR
jgi:hypothetical protein